MSTLIEDITALLGTTGPAGGVHYGVNAMQPPVYPYIVWQRIVSSANVNLEGPSDLQSTMIQVDIYSDRIAQADTVARQVAQAFAAWPVQNAPQSSQDFYEDPVKAFRISQDYLIWATN